MDEKIINCEGYIGNLKFIDLEEKQRSDNSRHDSHCGHHSVLREEQIALAEKQDKIKFSGSKPLMLRQVGTKISLPAPP